MELRQKFPSIKLKIWLKISNLPKSSFYEWVKKLEIVNKEEVKLTNAIKNIFEESNKKRCQALKLLTYSFGLYVYKTD